MQIMSLVFHLSFLAFFLRLGTIWLVLIPLMGIFLQFVWQGGFHLQEQDRTEYMRDHLIKHGITIAWVLIMLGVMGIFELYGILSYDIALDLFLVNLALRYAATWFGNQDGMKMFFTGKYLALIMLLWTMPSMPRQVVLLFIGILFALLMAIYAFMMFLIQPTDTRTTQHRGFLLFMYTIISLLYLIYGYSYDEPYMTVVLGQVLLLVIYIVIYLVHRYRSQIHWHQDHQEDAFLRILSGRRLHTQRKVEEIDALIGLDSFLTKIPDTQKSLLAGMNIVLMIIQVVIFLRNIGGGLVWIRQIFFRFGIVVFFVGYLLLRHIDFPHTYQRVVAFVMLQFGIYVSLLNIFGNNIEQIVVFGIVWSLLSSSMMAVSDMFADFRFSRQDYVTRAIANIFASVCNLYFIILLPFVAQAKFAIAFLYLGMQFFMILMGLKKVLKL